MTAVAMYYEAAERLDALRLVGTADEVHVAQMEVQELAAKAREELAAERLAVRRQCDSLFADLGSIFKPQRA